VTVLQERGFSGQENECRKKMFTFNPAIEYLRGIVYLGAEERGIESPVRGLSHGDDRCSRK
jgi:hypothetical protein